MTRIAAVFLRTCIPLLFLFAVPGVCPAQQQPTLLWRAGVGLAPVFTLHSASFEALPGVVPPAATSAFSPSGTSPGFGAVVFAEAPFFRWSNIGILAGYTVVPAVFTATELIPVQTDAGLVTATVAHTIDAQLHYAGGELFTHIPLPGRMGIRLGPRIDVLVSSSFEQAQELTDPDLDFVGFEGKVLVGSGELPDAAPVRFSLAGAVTYPFDVSNALQLQLEGGVRVGLSDVVSGVDWTSSSIQAGVSVVYSSRTAQQILADTVYQRDTTLRLVAGLAEARIRLVDSDSVLQRTEIPDAILSTLTFRERYVRELPRPQALLTAGMAIRFVLDDGSEATEASGEIRTVEEIRHVLVSGQIVYDSVVADNPVFGLFSQEFGEEQQSELGFKAQDMQRRLLRHLGKKAAVLPKLRVVSYGSEQVMQDAIGRVQKLCADAWAQRSEAVVVQVDLAAKRLAEAIAGIAIGEEIPDAFVVRDTVVRLPVKRVLLYPEVVSEAGIRHWEMQLAVGGRELYVQSGEGDVPRSLAWMPGDDIDDLVPNAPIQCRLTVVDRNGQQQNTFGTIFFRRSGNSNSGRVDTTIVRFILHGRELDGKAIDYIQRQVRAIGAPALSLSYWYTAATESDVPFYSLNRGMHALGVARPAMHQVVVPGIHRQSRSANDIIEIRAGVRK